MTTILVPLDGSPLAERALPYAVRIASAMGAQLRLVRACVAAPPVLLDSGAAVRVAIAVHAAELHDARRAMDQQVAALRSVGASVDGVVHSGDAPDVILGEAQACGADLIVMTTHGRGGLTRALYGSVADAVLRRSTVPVLLVPEAVPPSAEAGYPGRIVVALDGSSLAEASLRPALGLARAGGGRLELLRVVDPPEGLGKHAFLRAERAKAYRYLRVQAKRVGDAGVEAAVHVRVGPVVATILAAADQLDAGLIAAGTHGRGGLSRLVMGSVATGLVEHSKVPLLLVSALGVNSSGRPSALLAPLAHRGAR
jgi:nucleotide-binding universal stress UspA family protein